MQLSRMLGTINVRARTKSWFHRRTEINDAVNKATTHQISASFFNVARKLRLQPHGLVEQVPNSQFQISGPTVAVGVHGDMITLTARPHRPFSSYEGPRWHSIEFDAAACLPSLAA
jgi:hypothetical protein